MQNIISSNSRSLTQRLQAYKYELKPNGEQQRNMLRFAGSCRFVYNKALALQQERHTAGEKKLGYSGLCTLLTEEPTEATTQELLLFSAVGIASLQAGEDVKTVERADGSEKSYAQCLVTPKGVAKLSLLFAHKMACDASTSEV